MTLASHAVIIEGAWGDVTSAMDAINSLDTVVAYFLTDQAQAERIVRECLGLCSSHGDFDATLYRSCPLCYAEDHPQPDTEERS